jgi:hypothetical protein
MSKRAVWKRRKRRAPRGFAFVGTSQMHTGAESPEFFARRLIAKYVHFAKANE